MKLFKKYLNQSLKAIQTILGISLLLFSTNMVHATPDGDALKTLLSPINTLQGSFKQTVKSEKGRVLQNLSGVMYLKKPGLFRWEVNGKNSRVVVADGKQVYDYDKDLAQVTVQKMNQGCTKAPIFFLTGDVDTLEEDFKVRSLSNDKQCLNESDACFELMPKTREGSFQWIKIGFKDGNLKEMEMLDQLGQRSHFVFQHVVKNEKLDPAIFRFKAPKGADVLHND